MSDILIRDVPEDVVAEIDAQASRIGLSRVEYLRRQLVRESRRVKATVTAEDLEYSSGLLGGLLDERLMSDAWR